MTEIKFDAVSEETTGWLRKCYATWKGHRVSLQFGWDTYNGYERYATDVERLPEELRAEFMEWYENIDDDVLDDLTWQSLTNDNYEKRGMN